VGSFVLDAIENELTECERVSALWRNRLRKGDRQILYKRVVDIAKVSHHKSSILHQPLIF